jgi:hypothetical protein
MLKSGTPEWFEALDKKITRPLCFGVMAPANTAYTNCLQPKDIEPFGWESFAWKESTHTDKTYVQFVVRRLDRPDIPKGKLTARDGLPGLGCSAFLLDIPKPRGNITLPEGLTRNVGTAVDNSAILTLVRAARPMAKATLAKLREAGFKLIARLNNNSYFVRGYWGMGSVAECKY